MSNKECELDNIIKKDLNRTYNEYTQIFDTNNKENIIDEQNRLQRILRAYSHFDKEVGYTGGMNFIVISLLLNLNPQNDREVEIIDNSFEENVFWIFVHIMLQKNWRLLFLDGTPGIFQILDKFDIKLQQELPQIRQKIIDCGLSVYICFPQYFFTILLYNSPKNFQKRVIDLFLFKGEEALMQIIINMLNFCQDIILKIEDTEDIMQFLRKGIMIKCQNILKFEQDEEQYLVC
ncbi:Rab6 GTPase activating GAPCenA, putative [Ichthyophthirius multifiliis]|uniref:Rab6 GTPase activating GAPCenA, putative n=1 Tax=Ichthyophthirius multifiliis TaxID=5932 RepID=G0R5F0_ICHMU|nr:Rab6 GTPase activating GAPCenA, putative [Ichthyophthirius multifiliis]EGR27308.1 Rab6 GTPase activating GAPCenA, putative [Ichthyophthirius multifiliis]|eukprot:XP_004024192.1 Rab6 GTPase activating GAPCenA, putative [Ichthyophthirius multifiliis]